MKSKKIILAVIVSLMVSAMMGCGKTETQQQTADVEKQSETASDESDAESIYLSAKGHLEEKDYAAAIKDLETIPDYKDAKELLQDARYEYGVALYDKSQYAGAIEQLEQVGEYQEAASYLDKSYMEQKYEDFDYDSFSTLADDSTATMTNKEIREYMEECQEALYDKWYQHENEDKYIEIEKYKLDGKVYKVVSWGGEGNYTEYDICYLDDSENKIHISMTPNFTYMELAEKTPMYLSIGDEGYCNYTSKQDEEYAAQDQERYEEATKTKEYYSPGLAYSDNLIVYVYYAYIGYDAEQNTNVVRVDCSIGNNGNSNIQFTACDYFSLEYNGVITGARGTKYDNSVLAPGGQIDGELVFNCPAATRAGDTLKMTMRMENTQVHLGPVPMDSEERSGFAGTYMNSSPSFDTIFTVIDKGDGKYEVTEVADALNFHKIYESVTLNKNNEFKLDDTKYTWEREGNYIYKYVDNWEGDGKDRWDYYMQNPMK